MRVLHLTDEKARCAIQRLCGRCWKRDPVTCGVHRLFQVFAPVMALISLIPWSVPLRPGYVTLSVFHHDAFWTRSLIQLLIEQRVYPAIAAICFIVATVVLSGGLRWVRRSEVPFFIGMGFLSFAALRFFLSNSFPAMPAWSDVWEETTELITICAVALILWVFRVQLGLRPRPRGARAAAKGDEP